MRTAYKIMAAVIVLHAISIADIGCSTGDLILSRQTATSWPPLALTRPSLQVHYDTENFRIHFDITGNNAVYESEVDLNPHDGVPDYVNRMGEYLESSRFSYVNVHGFDPPPPDDGLGGNNLYDIYVTEISGLVVPEFPSDHYPGRQAYSSYAFIGRDLRNQHHPDDPLPFLMATCSHEYFHAVQMAYRAFSRDETPWWYELSAVFAEELVFDDLNELYYYLPDYYLKIDKSLYLTGGSHMYGSWVFAQYLYQNHGIEFIRRVFEKLINLDQSLVALSVAFAEGNLNFVVEYAEFMSWNYFTAVNWRPGFFEEGADFPLSVPLARIHDIYPTGMVVNPKAIENLGGAYVVFNDPGIPKSELVIDFNGDDDYPLVVSLGSIPDSGPVTFGIYFVPADQSLTVRIPRFQDLGSVLMTVTWPFQGFTIRDSAEFSYRADVDTNETSIETAESAAVPGIFRLGGNHPNPFNGATCINFEWNSDPENYKFELMDAAGRKIGEAVGKAESGLNRIRWRMADDLACGVYFYKLSIGGFARTGRMLYLK